LETGASELPDGLVRKSADEILDWIRWTGAEKSEIQHSEEFSMRKCLENGQKYEFKEMTLY
jgi:hypothetical protein